MSDAEGGEVKDENNGDGIDKQSTMDIVVKPLVEEDNQEDKNSGQLQRPCRSTNVSSQTSSSLSAKFDQDPVSVGKDTDETQLCKGSEEDLEDAPVDGSSIGDLSNPSQNSKDIDSDVKKVPAVEEEQGLSCVNGQGNCINPMTSLEKSLMQVQEGNDVLSGFGRSSSMSMEKGEKRVLDVDDTWDGTKRPREWAPSVGTQSDGCLSLFNSLEKPQTSEEPMTYFEERADQKRLLDMSLFPEGDVSCIDYAEEKKLFPRSFKTCDLNLMEASEVNENYNTESVHLFPSMNESGKQAMPVDIDLTMSNNGNATEKYGKSGSHGKDIEVIDLENDSVQQEEAFNGSERRAESVFTGLDGFPNNAHNNNEIPDVQDGYGLMLSELLGNDIPNCPSVPPDMNTLHNDMSLPNGEGILGDDDSIYMTLGEIPISFLRVWEQPTQEYGKPF